MSVYTTFTSNPDCVQLVDNYLELFHQLTGACDTPDACPTCKFLNSEACSVNIHNPDNKPIYDFFKLNHPDKLI